MSWVIGALILVILVGAFVWARRSRASSAKGFSVVTRLSGVTKDFDRSAWLSGKSSDNLENERLAMADDLCDILDRDKPGRAEVLSMLGAPSPEVSPQDVRSGPIRKQMSPGTTDVLVYDLGSDEAGQEQFLTVGFESDRYGFASVAEGLRKDGEDETKY